MQRRLSVSMALALAACAASLPAAAAQTPDAGAPFSASNPFFAASTLAFQAPPFDKIHEGDFAPAIEEGMKRQLAEIAKIAENPEAPTFANTIEAMERSGELLNRVSRVLFNLTESNTSEALQKIKAEESPKLAAHQDAISLNAKLFERVQTIYGKREGLGLDPEAKYLVERLQRNFVRAGARLNAADQTVLRSLNQEESKLTTDFSERLLADTNDSAVVVDDRAELAGLGDGDLEAAAETARERNLGGKWVLSLQNTTQQPVLAFLTNRTLRERILKASMLRGNHGGANDTKAIVARLAALRARRAKLLGFSSDAAYVLDDEMARTPENAEKLLTDLVPPATSRARDEAARMQKLVDSEKGGFALGAADWQLYAEKLRHAEYDLDELQVRPYLDLERVLRDGVFFAANKLYGITFRERKDIPVYQADVRVFEVFDADGKPLALYYGDYFRRPNKSGGAWCDSFVGQSRLTGDRPAVVTVTNFTRPTPGQPALLSFADVTALFHEFGHALHAMFSDVTYPTLGSTPRDFMEFPSQFNEHWALEPAVLASYAKHFRTGEPMPQALVDKIRKARGFNQGYATTESLGAALLDMAWHSVPDGVPPQDVNAFEPAALARFHVDLPQVPPRYRTTYFSHIWDGGYEAGYYAYLWSELIDDDAFAWFREHGGMTRANGQRFRDMILSRGGTEDVARLYRAFRGRDPVADPLLEERGLKPSNRSGAN